MRKRFYVEHGRRGGRAVRSNAATYLDKRGMSEAMWEALATVYQGRLSRDRGHRAALNDPTLNALWKRGLVQGQDVAGYEGWLWTLTDIGVQMVKAGPDATP